VSSRGLPSQTIGPFYDFALTANQQLGRMAGPDAKGDRILLRLTLFDGDGAPVPDGMIELWQADAGGKYDHPNDAQEKLPDPAFCGFGRLATDANGVCLFETIRPGPVPGESGAWQALTSTLRSSRAACWDGSSQGYISRATPRWKQIRFWRWFRPIAGER